MARACHQCGQVWTEKRSPGFREECSKCGEPLHCCANCRFYDAQAHMWCREPQARETRPRDAEQANVCEYFLFGEAADHGEADRRAERARAGLAALFGTPAAGTDDLEAGGQR